MTSECVSKQHTSFCCDIYAGDVNNSLEWPKWTIGRKPLLLWLTLVVYSNDH